MIVDDLSHLRVEADSWFICRSEARGVPSLLVANALPISAVFEYGGRDEESEDGEVYEASEDVNKEEYEQEEEDTRGWLLYRHCHSLLPATPLITRQGCN